MSCVSKEVLSSIDNHGVECLPRKIYAVSKVIFHCVSESFQDCVGPVIEVIEGLAFDIYTGVPLAGRRDSINERNKSAIRNH